MPNVPVYSSPSVEPTALPGVRQQTPYRLMQAATIGPAEVANAGKMMQQAGKEIAQEVTYEQIQENEAAAKEFDGKQIGATQGVVDKFLSLKGSDATGPAFDEAVDTIKKIPQDMADNLANPAQAEIVKPGAKLRAYAAIGQLQAHKRQQVDVYETAASQTRIKAASDAAAGSYNPMTDTPSLKFDHDAPETNSSYQLNLQTVASEARDRAAKVYGSGDQAADLRDQYVKDALANTYISTLGHLTDGKNATTADMKVARTYFDSIKGELSTEQRDKVKAVLEAGDLKNKALTLALEVGEKFGGIGAQEKELNRRFKAGEITEPEHTYALSHLRSDDTQRREQQTEGDRKFMGDLWDFARQGGKITDLKPSQIAYIKSRNLGPHVDSVFNGAERNIDDSQLYSDLSKQSAEDPSGFVRQDLAKLRGQLTEAHWNHLIGMQTTINRNDVKAMDMNKTIHVAVSDTRDALKAAGFDIHAKPNTSGAKTMAEFETQMRDALTAAQSTWEEKKLTPTQQREEARKITLGMLKDQALAGTQTIPIFGSNTHKRVYSMTPEERRANWVVPDSDRKLISDSLTRQGLAPTEDNIQRAYKLSQGVQ